MISVSASHSWGNSWATWATGQCCWHSCSPDRDVVRPRRRSRPRASPGPAPRRAAASGSAAWMRVDALLEARRAGARANSATASSPPVSARNRSAWAARSSYCCSNWSRPASVSAKTLAGRPRPRRAADARARGPRPCRSRACGRGGGGRRPGSGRAARRATAAVLGPRSRIVRATRSRVGASRRVLRSAAHAMRVSHDFHNTIVPLMHAPLQIRLPLPRRPRAMPPSAGRRAARATRRRAAVLRLAGVSDASARRRGRGPADAYGDKVAVDGLDLTVERGSITAVLGPERRRQDHHAGDLRGVPPPPAGHGPGARPRPAGDRRRAAPPHRGDAAVRRRLDRRPRRGDAPPHRGAARAPAAGPDARRAARPRATAGARRTDGSPAASSSGSRSRWRVVGRPELLFVDEPTAGHGPAGAAGHVGRCSRSCAPTG